MNREELKQEAEEKYIKRLKQDGIEVEYRNETYNDGYLDAAEPREERISVLEKENTDLRGKLIFLSNLFKAWQKEFDKAEQFLKDSEVRDDGTHSTT